LRWLVGHLQNQLTTLIDRLGSASVACHFGPHLAVEHPAISRFSSSPMDTVAQPSSGTEWKSTVAFDDSTSSNNDPFPRSVISFSDLPPPLLFGDYDSRPAPRSRLLPDPTSIGYRRQSTTSQEMAIELSSRPVSHAERDLFDGECRLPKASLGFDDTSGMEVGAQCSAGGLLEQQTQVSQ
jgi:hypothetical protein